MIKKFVSNALLSVVMDKDARKKLNDARSAKSPQKKKAVGRKADREPLDDHASGEDVIETIAQALAEARAEVSRGTGPAGKVSAKREKPAPSAPKRQPTPQAPSPTPSSSSKSPSATPERERLIQEAQAIHRQKSHVLDELDPALKEKLMVMAMYAMDPSSLPPKVRAQAKADAEAEGLIDDTGSNARPPRKK